MRSACANVLHRARKNHEGKVVHLDNLHLTLAFLGEVSDAQRACAEHMADSLSVLPFTLRFDHLGWFKRSKVLWLGANETPAALGQLVMNLNQGLRDCDILLDERPFAAHLTLMRKVRTFHDMAVEPIDWRVDRFCLIESLTAPEGVVYKVLKTWP